MANSLNEKQDEERTLPFMLVKASIYIILQVMSFLMIERILFGEFSSSDGVGYRLPGSLIILFLTGLSAIALASFFTTRKYVKPALILWLCLSPLFIYLMIHYPIISGFLALFLWIGTVGTCICIRSNSFWKNWLMMAFSLLLMVLISFWVCHIAWGLKAEKCEVKEIKFDGPRVTEIKKVFNCSIDLFGWKMFGWEDELETTRCITSEGCTTFKKGK